MSVTIKDCLNLPSLRMGKVVAGHEGLSSIVQSISVIEFTDDEEIYTPNELIISSLYQVKDSVLNQYKVIENCKNTGGVGMVLFYSDIILQGIDPMLIDLADDLKFPLILLPGKNSNLKYSDVISDVMEAIFYDNNIHGSFVTNTLERINQLPISELTLKNVLLLMSQVSKISMFIFDENGNVLSSYLRPELEYRIKKEYTSANTFDNCLNIQDFKMPDNLFTDQRKILLDNGNFIYIKLISNNTNLFNKYAYDFSVILKEFFKSYQYEISPYKKDSIITHLLTEEYDSARNIAKSHGINLDFLDTCVIIPIFKLSRSKVNIIKEKIYGLINNPTLSLLTIYSNNCIVFYSKKEEPYFLNSLLSLFNNNVNNYVFFNNIEHIGFLENLVDLKSFTKEVHSFNKSFRIAKKIYPNNFLISKEYIHLSELCYNIVHYMNEKLPEDYIKILTPLILENDKQLIPTLTTYLLDTQNDILETSKKLYIHRNTVQYRINKINQLLSTDINKMPALYEVYLAVALLRIDGSKF